MQTEKLKKRKISSYPLQYFLSFQFLLASLLPIIIIGILTYVFVRPQIQQNNINHQESIAVALTEQINLILTNASSNLSLVASLIDPDASKEETTQLLDKFYTTNTFFDALYLTDEAGLVNVTVLPMVRRHLTSNYEGLDMSHLPFYRASVATKKSQWSGTFLSTVNGRLSIAYIIPLTSGALIGEISISGLPSLAASLAKQQSLTIMILDQKGQLIAHPNSAYSDQQINLANLNLFRSASKRTMSENYTFMQKDMFGTSIRLNSPQWVIIVAEETLQMAQQTSATLAVLLTSAIIALLAAIVFGTVIASVFSNKFHIYTHYAKRLAEGDYNLPVHHSRISEFAEMAEHQQQTAAAIKLREQTILAREQRYKQLLNQSPVGIIEWDPDYMVLQWNATLVKMLGYTREEAVSKVPPAALQQLLHTLRELAAGKSPASSEHTLQTRLGDKLQCQMLQATVVLAGNQPVAYLTLIQDVTDKRRNEAKLQELNEQLESRVQLRTRELESTNDELKNALKSLRVAQSELVKSEKLAGLGALVAGISHELNTPIGNGLMAASTLQDQTQVIEKLLRDETLTEEKLSSYLSDATLGSDIISRNLNRASDLIASFKQVAVDQTSEQRRVFDLATLVNEVVMTLKPTLKKLPVKIIVDITDSIELNSYPGPLGQIITNLINNAIIHGLPGSVDDQICISAKRRGDNLVHIEIQDNGRGIPAEHLDVIFNPFFTTKLGQGGSGLGLNIAHNMTENILKGRISVHSLPERGATFSLDIPLSPSV